MFMVFNSFSQNKELDVILNSVESNLEIELHLEITDSNVTLEVEGPLKRYFAISFLDNSVTSVMDNAGGDVFIYTGTSGVLTSHDYNLSGSQGRPNLDESQDWNLDSVTEDTGNSRVSIIASRPVTNEDILDFQFNNSLNSISIGWAIGGFEDSTYSNIFVGGHGSRKGLELIDLSLSNEKFNLKSFKLTPNPVKDNLNLQFGNNFNKGELIIYDVFGKIILKKYLNNRNQFIDVKHLKKGLYLLEVKDDYESISKKFLKN